MCCFYFFLLVLNFLFFQSKDFGLFLVELGNTVGSYYQLLLFFYFFEFFHKDILESCYLWFYNLSHKQKSLFFPCFCLRNVNL